MLRLCAALSLARRILYNNNLDGTIPASLGSLTSLQILCVPGTGAQALCCTEPLARRYLYNNYLDGTIPASLGSLTNLRWVV